MTHSFRALLATAATAVVLVVAGPGRAEEPAAPLAVTTRFFDAFVKGDCATLEAIYSPDVKWKDTIFSFPDRAGTMGMWRILLDPKNGGKFTYKVVEQNGNTVVVNWLADYALFGRPIHNDVTATVVVENGRVVRHTDVYSWDKWAKQAFPLGNASAWPPLKAILIGVLRVTMNVQIGLAEMRAPQPKPAAPKSPAPKGPPTKGIMGGLGR